MGTISKDNSTGPFIEEWKKAFGEISKDVEEVDITTGLSAAALAIKDENELVSPRPDQLCEKYSLLTFELAFYAQRIKSLYWTHG